MPAKLGWKMQEELSRNALVNFSLILAGSSGTRGRAAED